jgi:hypothetical protein
MYHIYVAPHLAEEAFSHTVRIGFEGLSDSTTLTDLGWLRMNAIVPSDGIKKGQIL